MQLLGFFLLSIPTLVLSSILNTFPFSPYGGFSYPLSYHTILSNSRAKYYAKKAYDLARLRNGIYGVGNGFYGYRYGYWPFYSKPFIEKPLPIFYGPPSTYFSALSLPFIQPSIASDIFWKYPLGYPAQSYSNSYHSKWAYGNGYSYGYQNYAGPSGYVSAVYIPPLNEPYIKGSPLLLNQVSFPYKSGYQFERFPNNPPLSKSISFPPLSISANPIYGFSYKSSPYDSSYKGKRILPWIGTIPGKSVESPILSVGLSSIYGPKFTNFPVTFSNIKSSQWNDQSSDGSFKNIGPLNGYDSIEGSKYSPPNLPFKGTELQQWNELKEIAIGKVPGDGFDSYKSLKFNNDIFKSSSVSRNAPVKEDLTSDLLNIPGTYSLIPPSGTNHASLPVSFAQYPFINNVFSARLDSNLTNHSNVFSSTEEGNKNQEP